MTEIVERARARTPSPVVAKLEHEPLNLLANICAELQRHAGKDHFYLSVRKAGEAITVNHQTAWRYLKELRRLKLLSLSEAGTRGPKGKAARWRYSEQGE